MKGLGNGTGDECGVGERLFLVKKSLIMGGHGRSREVNVGCS